MLSLAEEAHESATAADHALCLQVYLTEIVTDSYQIEKISPPPEYPSPDPFGQAPTDQEVTAQCQSEISPTRQITANVAIVKPRLQGGADLWHRGRTRQTKGHNASDVVQTDDAHGLLFIIHCNFTDPSSAT